MITFYLLKEFPEKVRTRWKKVSANSLIEKIAVSDVTSLMLPRPY